MASSGKTSSGDDALFCAPQELLKMQTALLCLCLCLLGMAISIPVSMALPSVLPKVHYLMCPRTLSVAGKYELYLYTAPGICCGVSLRHRGEPIRKIILALMCLSTSLKFSSLGIAQRLVRVAVTLPLGFCGFGIYPELLAWEQPEWSRGKGKMLVLPVQAGVGGALAVMFELSQCEIQTDITKTKGKLR